MYIFDLIRTSLKQVQMLGEKLKELRERNGMVQRKVAADLQIDIAYISKMEHNEKPVNRGHLLKLAHLYNIPESELIPIWLADKVLDLIGNENFKDQALELALIKAKIK